MKPNRWHPDTEIAQRTPLSLSWLRKDRAGRQLIPFHRIGRKCLYDLDEVTQAIEQARVGGTGAA